MAFEMKPNPPLTKGNLRDKIENRKWSEKKDKDAEVKQHGPKRIHNPDKLMGDGRTKEQWVRSGDRADYNKEALKSWGISLGGALLGFLGGKKLMK